MGINLKFPLRAYRKGFFEMNNTTRDAIREDIKILLLTKKGERVVNGSIGTNIPILAGQLFEPAIREDLEPQITLEWEKISEDPNTNFQNLLIGTTEKIALENFKRFRNTVFTNSLRILGLNSNTKRH